MGSGNDTLSSGVSLDQQGIIPRTVRDIYEQLEISTHGKRKTDTGTSNTEDTAGPDTPQADHKDTAADAQTDSYAVSVSFIELYNDDIVDLLHPSAGESGDHTKPNPISIVEDRQTGDTYLKGVTKETSRDAAEVFAHLQRGSDARTTAATNMNATSSRSHAILTIHITRTSSHGVSTTSKFNFVDLAGSERLKRTNATGNRAKEGIAINSGLLALGNVISALGDAQTKRERRKESHSPSPTSPNPGASPRGLNRNTSTNSGRRGLEPTPPLKTRSATALVLSVSSPKASNDFIPYRSSKLTRLLKDSLGGNSLTLMIACVSPSDGDFMETRNTLNYANRAKKIKNKPVVLSQMAGGVGMVNAELVAEVAALKAQLHKLQLENTAQKEVIRNTAREREQESVREQLRKKAATASVCKKCGGGDGATAPGVKVEGQVAETGDDAVHVVSAERDGAWESGTDRALHTRLEKIRAEKAQADQVIAALSSKLADQERDIYQLVNLGVMNAGDGMGTGGLPRINSSASLNSYRNGGQTTPNSQHSAYRRGSEVSIGGSAGSLTLHSTGLATEKQTSGLGARPIKSFDIGRESPTKNAVRTAAAHADEQKGVEGSLGDSVDDLMDKYKHLAHGPDPEVLERNQIRVEEIIASEIAVGMSYSQYEKLVDRRNNKVEEKKAVEAQLRKLLENYRDAVYEPETNSPSESAHHGDDQDHPTTDMIHTGRQTKPRWSPSEDKALQDQISMVTALIEGLDLEQDALTTEISKMEHSMPEEDNPEHTLNEFVGALGYSEMRAMFPYLVNKAAYATRELLATMEK